MRGKPDRVTVVTSPARNIPAYAGKTRTNQAGGVKRAEHPRVCGENLVAVCFPRIGVGTSPRMRGKRLSIINDVEQFRNIPAYAGKTLPISVFKRFIWEHPRVCGENHTGQ